MKKISIFSTAVFAAAVVAGGIALAQDTTPQAAPGQGAGAQQTQPGGGYGRGQGGGYRHGWRGEGRGEGYGAGHGMGRREGRGFGGGWADPATLAARKTELAITPAQEKLWTDYVNAVEAIAEARKAREAIDRDKMRAMSAEDRQKFRTAQRENMQKNREALIKSRDALVAALTDEQKAKFNTGQRFAQNRQGGMGYGHGHGMGYGMGRHSEGRGGRGWGDSHHGQRGGWRGGRDGGHRH